MVREFTPDDLAARRDVFPRIWSALLLLLLAGTWPLWLADRGEYPSIPLIPTSLLAGSFGTITQWIVLWILLAGLLMTLMGKAGRWASTVWWMVAFGLGLLMVADQHRIQSWAYQSFLYAALFAAMPARSRKPWLMAVTISIYFFSSVGKLDYQFLHTVGKEFLETGLTIVGGVPGHLKNHETKLVAMMPLAELSIAVLLCIPKTRRLAGFGAIGMHATLIGLLGPWAMNHSWGVLLWNVLLAIQAWWLFARKAENAACSMTENTSRPDTNRTVPNRNVTWSRVVAKSMVVISVVMPTTERLGVWDHWTSWALYSPHSSRVSVQVEQSAIEKLPDSLQAAVLSDDDRDGWRTMALDRWSLDQRGVPIYPQARYQLALAIEIAERHSLGRAIRGRIRSVSDRWDGTREETLVLGKKEFVQAQNGFWLLPRKANR